MHLINTLCDANISCYGKSVGNLEPSLYMKKVFSKAESAGSEITKLPLKIALSQSCVCGLKSRQRCSQFLSGAFLRRERDGWQSGRATYRPVKPRSR